MPGRRVGEDGVDRSIRELSRGLKKLSVWIVVRLYDHTFVKTYQTLQKGDFSCTTINLNFFKKIEISKPKEKKGQGCAVAELPYVSLQWRETLTWRNPIAY